MYWKATDYEAQDGPLRYSTWPMHDERGWAFGVEFVGDGQQTLIYSRAGFKTEKEARKAAEKMHAGESND